jgi:uncharacterized membrane-anchored protein
LTEENFSINYDQQATISATEAENALVSGRWEEAKEKYTLYNIELENFCLVFLMLIHCNA